MAKGITAIIDYGVGNLFSLNSSLIACGADCVITSDAQDLKNASRIVLPGVGAFEDAAKKLDDTGLVETIKEQVKNGKPLLGICLGMQMLFEKSYEYGEHKGLGLIPGSVIPLKEEPKCASLKIPHIGWNYLQLREGEELFKYLPKDNYVYYVHSFYAKTEKEYITSTSEYGIDVTGSVRNGNVMGTQFHPEKSGSCGLLMLKAFCEM